MGGGWGRTGGRAGFSLALRCLIRRWRALEPWVAAEAGEVRRSRFQLARLGDVVTRRRETVDLETSFGAWTPITVHLDGGISPRDRTVPYKGKTYAAHPGDVVFSKIDARNGAIGVLPQQIAKAVVTTEFPVFVAAADRLDGGFLKLVLRASEFLAALRARASGTSGRKRITPEAFTDLRVPLPPLPEQRAIAAAHRAALNRADDLESEAGETEAEAMRNFEAALGFEPRAALPDRPVLAASFKLLDRWSHEAALAATLRVNTAAPRFPVVELGTVGSVRYGLQKSPSNRPSRYPRPYLRVANVQRWRLDLTEIKMIEVPDQEMPAYRLEHGDILLCEGNSPELVGRGAIWRNEIVDCVHQNHVLRARMDASKVDPGFALAVINSGYGQAYFRSKAKRTTNLASINSREVSEFPLPLPSLHRQRSLLTALFNAQRNAKGLRERAAAARTKAWTDFEAALYSDAGRATDPTDA